MYLHYVCNHIEAKGNFEERITLEKKPTKQHQMQAWKHLNMQAGIFIIQKYERNYL